MPQDIQSFKRARAASRDEQAVWMRFIRMFKRNKTLRYIFIVILFLFIIFYTWATLSLEKLNEIGDAFNILNTFFTALAFIGLILTILLQRKDLALQREELKLQREEMQRQCEEQKRQADEFEEQNRLMKIQHFESFFNTYFDIILKMKNNIYDIKLNTNGVLENIFYSGYGIMDKMFTNNVDHLSKIQLMKVIKGIVAKMRFYGDSLYTFFKYIIDNNYLSENQKLLYLRILSNSLDDTENKMIYFYGIFSKYYDIVRHLHENKILYKDDRIDYFLKGEKLDYLRSNMNGERNVWLQSIQPTPVEK